MFRKFVIFMLVLLITLTASLSACLADVEMEHPVQLRYSYITSIDGSFSISGGEAQCFGTGQSRSNDTTTTVKVTLQKRITGSSTWLAVCSWSDMQSGTTLACVDEERSVNIDYDYRIYVKCTIKDSEGSTLETAGLYSRIITYQ